MKDKRTVGEKGEDFEAYVVRLLWDGFSPEDLVRRVGVAQMNFSNKVLEHAQALGHTK